jgi:hypothetical protein
MRRTHAMTRAIRWTAGGLGLMPLGYATVVGTTWSRYGHVPSASPDERDPLLDQFMPEYEVAERHHVRVTAPPAITLAAAADTDLQRSRIVRAIFKAREMVLGTEPDAATRPKGLLAQTTSLGWHVLGETPGREIVVGAVTQPWLPNVVFRGLGPRRVSSLPPIGLREDRLDATSGSSRRVRVDVPHRDARDDDGSHGAHQVPVVLGALLARHRPDSERHARTAEGGG